MRTCRAGWSPANIQACHPSNYPEREGALLGYPPHAIPSTIILALPRPSAGYHKSLRAWSGQAFDTHPGPIPGTPWPHLPAPAQVTRGRYTSQLFNETEKPSSIPSSHLPPKGYGCCLANAPFPHDFTK